MAPQLVATAKLHWLDPDSGGRKALPSGSIYAATGRFAEREDELFSVVLRFPMKEAAPRQLHSGSLEFLYSLQVKDKLEPRIWDEAEIGFLAPELVEKKLAPGVKLLITEGHKIVAECEIQNVSEADLTP
jgi:hypothetical protein